MMVSASADGGELAKALLAPFKSTFKTADELATALGSELERKLPVIADYWDEYFKGNKTAEKVFELESEVSSPQITCVLGAACVKCLKSAGYAYGDSKSAKVSQSYWDAVFCNIWDCLLELAGVQRHVEYTRDHVVGSSVAASCEGLYKSDLWLKVHGKEVVYFEEDSGKADAAQHALRKVRKFDPSFFKPLSYNDGGDFVQVVCSYSWY